MRRLMRRRGWGGGEGMVKRWGCLRNGQFDVWFCIFLFGSDPFSIQSYM